MERIFRKLRYLDIGIMDNFNDLFRYKGGKISIKKVLNDDSLYNNSMKSLHNWNLFYIDQFIDPINKSILEWPLFNKTNKFTAKGTIPK